MIQIDPVIVILKNPIEILGQEKRENRFKKEKTMFFNVIHKSSHIKVDPEEDPQEIQTNQRMHSKISYSHLKMNKEKLFHFLMNIMIPKKETKYRF